MSIFDEEKFVAFVVRPTEVEVTIRWSDAFRARNGTPELTDNEILCFDSVALILLKAKKGDLLSTYDKCSGALKYELWEPYSKRVV